MTPVAGDRNNVHFECRKHNGHLFSDWFYGVAWDWCYCVIWEARGLVGLLCMTDTD